MQLTNIKLTIALLLLNVVSRAQVDHSKCTNHVLDYAPLYLMGTHIHEKSGLMISYRYMNMPMQGLREGTESTDQLNVFRSYMVTPLEMNMDMHMFSVMYAPATNLTVMLMGNYTSNKMSSQMMNSRSFETSSAGFGDLTALALFNLYGKTKHALNAQIGFNIPIGSISMVDATPMNENTKLAYPMQMGSGTWDPILGLNYQWTSKKLAVGAQLKHIFRYGRNLAGYNLGDESTIDGWMAYLFTERFNVNFGARLNIKGQIQGADTDFNQAMMPLFNSRNSGRELAQIAIGSNYFFSKGNIKNTRIGASYSIPVYQKVNGIQMAVKPVISLGVQQSF